MIAERLLKILEDISGVSGSFVMTHAGDLMVHSMPADFDTSELEACLLIYPELVHPHPLAHVARVELALRQIGSGLSRVVEPPHQLDGFDV